MICAGIRCVGVCCCNRKGVDAPLVRREHAGMLRVSIKRVRPDCVDELRAWMGTVNVQRRDEALATLAEETHARMSRRTSSMPATDQCFFT